MEAKKRRSKAKDGEKQWTGKARQSKEVVTWVSLRTYPHRFGTLLCVATDFLSVSPQGESKGFRGRLYSPMGNSSDSNVQSFLVQKELGSANGSAAK